jgi:hypothetical protein
MDRAARRGRNTHSWWDGGAVAVNLDTEPLVQDRPRIHKPDSPVPNSRCVLDTERVSSARVMRCSNRSPVAGGRVAPEQARTPNADR